MKKLRIMLILMVLTLLPTLSFGADSKVDADVVLYKQPLNTIDRVSMRTKNSAHFEKDSIGSKSFMVNVGLAPMHWDSVGTWKRFNFEKKATESALAAKTDSKVAVEFDEKIEPGPFKIEYQKDKPGRNKYTKRGTSIEFFPADNIADLPTTLTVSSTGAKEVVKLDSESPTRVAWGYKLVGHDTKRQLAENQPIYGSDGKTINGYFPALTAVDQDDDPVSLTTTITADSIIVQMGAFTEFALLDPTVHDTVVTGNASAEHVRNTVGTGFDQTRNVASGDDNQPISLAGTQFGSSTTAFYRQFLTFALDQMDEIVILDSAKLQFSISDLGTGDSALHVVMVRGTYTGTRHNDWFNDFDGWAASGAYDVTEYGSAHWTTHVAGENYISFNAEGIDSLKEYINSDSLRLAILTQDDVNGTYTVPQSCGHGTAFYQRIEFFYTEPTAPTIAAVEGDTTRFVDQEVHADLTDNGGFTYERGFQFFIYQNNEDTLTSSNVGDFSTGVFSDTLEGLVIDTKYVYRPYVFGYEDSAVGGWDTLSTVSGGVLTIDGRSVNTAK